MSNMPLLYPYARLGHPHNDESTLVEEMLKHYPFSQDDIQTIEHRTRRWIRQLRETPSSFIALEQLMHEYPINSNEGLALMQLAESLLRVPDHATTDLLIKDKLQHQNWLTHTTPEHSLLGKASGWCAWMAEKMITPNNQQNILSNLFHRLGESTVRHAVLAAIEHLGQQFVLGKNIEEALNRASQNTHPHTKYSFDSLGEGARTAADAQSYFDAYRHTLHVLGERQESGRIHSGSSISIKLSALYPRYEWLHYHRVMEFLYPRLLTLAQEARYYQIALTIDAEEADRLELSISLFDKLLAEPSLQNWGQLGLAIQAYSKRVLPLIDHLEQLAQRHNTTIPVRLVKGAYWDTEIKHAQERGFSNYPVFTHKLHTDLSYITAATKLLAARPRLYPQFATHNALTISQILEAANDTEGFELQRLHGMGTPLYEKIQSEYPVTCRIYAPVGIYSQLLAYLVRRMLENGANSSFVHQLTDHTIPIEQLSQDTKSTLLQTKSPHKQTMILPSELFGTERKNSEGIYLQHPDTLNDLRSNLLIREQPYEAHSLINGEACGDYTAPIYSPNDTSSYIGSAHFIENNERIQEAFAIAHRTHVEWNHVTVEERALCLERMATILEQRREEMLYMLCHEAGKTLQDSLDEIRESVDFCRYYAQQARHLFTHTGTLLPSPTGELNQLILEGRGVWLCISPWNFPLAIFLGQITAALVSGNCVIAKPAEQTPLTAHLACTWMHEAGIPTSALQLILGVGKHLSAALLASPYLAGVAFTGSTNTARQINQTLAGRPGAIIPLIAETGGQNTMIVDSTALLEHSCDAAIQSAFKSAGQRCSALRILLVQEDIAPHFIKMLTGAMKELITDASYQPSTDIGPLIDNAALERVQEHIEKINASGGGRLLYNAPLTAACQNGHFVAPHLIEVDSINHLKEEIFGPVLHIVKYRSSEWTNTFNQIHDLHYGLTIGIQTRIQARIEYASRYAQIGNIYINRGMTGAVVGSQPFGGHKLSGTGPKAGGPNYLLRFATEKTISINLTAASGNTALLSQK